MATIENSLEVIQKVKNRTIRSSNNPTSRYISIGNEVSGFTAAYDAIAKIWKQLMCLSTEDWIKVMLYTYRQRKPSTKCHLEEELRWHSSRGPYLCLIPQTQINIKSF